MTARRLAGWASTVALIAYFLAVGLEDELAQLEQSLEESEQARAELAAELAVARSLDEET